MGSHPESGPSSLPRDPRILGWAGGSHFANTGGNLSGENTWPPIRENGWLPIPEISAYLTGEN
jgi:hypothetical protein